MYTRDLTGELRPELRVGRSLILPFYILCIYCKPVYTSLIGMQLRLTTKLRGLTIGYYTTHYGLTPNDRYVYANFSTDIALILAGTTVPLYEFA